MLHLSSDRAAPQTDMAERVRVTAAVAATLMRVVPATRAEILVVREGRLQSLSQTAADILRASGLLARIHARLDPERDYVAPGIPAPRLLRGVSPDEDMAMVVPVFLEDEPVAVVFLEGDAEHLTLPHVRIVEDVVRMWLPLMLAAT